MAPPSRLRRGGSFKRTSVEHFFVYGIPRFFSLSNACPRWSCWSPCACGVVPLLSHANVGTIRILIPLLCQPTQMCTPVHHMHTLAIGAMICFFDYALCTHELLVTDNGRTRRLHARQVSMQKYYT